MKVKRIYDPKEIEPRWRESWLKEEVYRKRDDGGGEKVYVL